MKPELFMRKEKDALDLFAAFLNVGSMQATRSNFAKLRKALDKAEKRVVKEVRMKRMDGVSVGVHPYFRKRGSYDGEKMVVALRVSFTPEGMEHYGDVAKFARRLGFKEASMNVMARGTNNRGRIEELDHHRPVSHSDMSEVAGKKRRADMDFAKELLETARALLAGTDRIRVHGGRQAVSAVFDEEPDLDDVLYEYERGIRSELRRRGPYEVEASWRGRPKVDRRAGSVVLDGAVDYEVFVEVLSPSDIERVVAAEVRQG